MRFSLNVTQVTSLPQRSKGDNRNQCRMRLGAMLCVKPMRLRKYGPPFIICEVRLWSEAALTPPIHRE